MSTMTTIESQRHRCEKTDESERERAMRGKDRKWRCTRGGRKQAMEARERQREREGGRLLLLHVHDGKFGRTVLWRRSSRRPSPRRSML